MGDGAYDCVAEFMIRPVRAARANGGGGGRFPRIILVLQKFALFWYCVGMTNFRGPVPRAPLAGPMTHFDRDNRDDGS